MSKLNHLGSRAARMFGNVCLSRPVLAIGTSKAAVNTTAAAVFAIDGIIRNKAAMTSEVLVSGGAPFKVQPVNTTVYYVLALNAAGTVHCFQGTYAGEEILSPTGMSLRGDGSVPDIPDGYAPFGMIKVVTGSAAFTPATTLLDAANITFTFYDLMCLPASNP